jgi:hypothetical protein
VLSRDAVVTDDADEAQGRRAWPAAKARDLERAAARRTYAVAVAMAVGATLLFLGYLRVSWTVPATSDGAAQALQARDMLAGNWLLHGWTLSDVSFYTTELPEYVLVEAVRPFGLGVIHVAAAATYTLLVVAVVALACGRAGGREGVLRGTLAGGIMLAPQLGYGAFVLLLSPDHVGTQVPLLAGWLLLDLAPRRWWVPVALCLLLALVQFADRVAVLTAVLPLIVVCAVIAARRRPRRPAERAGGLVWRWARDCRFELALIAAGVASVGLSWAAARLLTAAGGFAGHPFPLTLAPLSLLWTHAWLTGWGILELYGANFVGVTGWAGLALATLHLIGLTLATAAVAVVLVRFVRTPAEVALIDILLAVAMVANLVSYLVSTAPGTVLGTGYDAREIAAVLPLGAVLAGRVFGPVLGRGQWTGGAESTDRSKKPVFISFAFFVMIGGYAGALGYSAAQAGAPGQESALAGWLVGHGLRYGLGGSSANVATVDSGGRAVVMPVAVRGGRVRALLYQASAAAFDPRLHDANFLVTRVPAAEPGEAAQTAAFSTVLATFGPPARSYRFDGYTVLVWTVNLLTRMRELAGKCGECSQSHILEPPADAAS